MMTNQRIQPLLYVLQSILSFSTRKMIITTFGFIFDVLYRPFYDTFLLCRLDVMGQSQEPAHLRILCIPSVETGCSPYLFTRFEIKRSASTSVFLSFDMLKGFPIIIFNCYP